jgi:hypothetical protein
MSGRRWLNRTVMGACAMLAGCNLLSGAADLVLDPDAASLVDVEGGGGPGGPDGPDSAMRGGQDGPVDPGDGGPLPMTDGATVDAMDAAPPRPDGGRFVFVTSTQLIGNLGGVAGADTSCTTIATSAGLGGAWMAWVSTPASAASSRLTSAGPWYLVTGVRVAASKAVLAASFGAIEHAIDRDELGGQRINSPVWTGGSVPSDCSDWTSGVANTFGTTGNTQYANFEWESLGNAMCNTTHRLYCFEN